MKTKRILCVLAAFVVTAAVSQAALVSFGTWATTPQTVGDVTFKLLSFSSVFGTTDQVSLFVNSSDNSQMNTFPNSYIRVSAGDSFEYEVTAKAGYVFDEVVMSHNGSMAPMTTIVTAGSSTWTLTQPGNQLKNFNVADGVTTLKIKNVFGAGLIEGASHTNVVSATIPEPATMLLLGLGGVFSLISRKRKTA
jgi:hypothetical protein